MLLRYLILSGLLLMFPLQPKVRTPSASPLRRCEGTFESRLVVVNQSHRGFVGKQGFYIATWIVPTVVELESDNIHNARSAGLHCDQKRHLGMKPAAGVNLSQLGSLLLLAYNDTMALLLGTTAVPDQTRAVQLSSPPVPGLHSVWRKTADYVTKNKSVRQ